MKNIIFRKTIYGVKNRAKNYFFKLFFNDISGYAELFVEEFGAKFKINLKSDLFKRIVFYKNYEPEVTKTINSLYDLPDFIDGDFIDIGANVGFFSIYVAKKINGSVFAIEPVITEVLDENVAINSIENIITIKAAVGDENGLLRINTIEGREEYSSFNVIPQKFSSSGNVKMLEVKVKTLDSVVEHYNIKPTVIKIDVEGFEVKVLKGAMSMITQFRPFILMEIAHTDRQGIHEICMAMSYEMVSIGDFQPVLSLTDYQKYDLLIVPKEKMKLLRLLKSRL